MRFLVCPGYYSDSFNANVKIALTIANELNKTNNSCDLLFLDTEISKKIKQEYMGMDLIRIPEYKDICDSKRLFHDCGLLSLLTKYPIHAFKYFVYIIRAQFYLLSYSEYISFIKQKDNNNEYDAIISFIHPFVPTYKISLLNTKAKKIAYQLDPWGFEEPYSKIIQFFRQIQEVRCFKNSDAVITTNLMYRQYFNSYKYKKTLSRIHILEFPNLKFNSRTKTYEDKKYDIYFLGILEDYYRDPTSIIDFIMSSSLDTRIIFIGKNYSDNCKKLCKKYPNRILTKEPIANDEALALMNSNKYLLNINNSIKNQSPSKLIDYISSGNPIINVIKNEDDISCDILNNYDYYFNYYEKKNNSINDFDNFLINSKNKRMSEKDIQDKYVNYTPEYVTKKIVEVIKDVK